MKQAAPQILLVVQKCGSNKYRFGITTKDSVLYFKYRGVKVILKINDIEYVTKTTCSQLVHFEDLKLKFIKGFDLYSDEISLLIHSQKWDKYKRGKPNQFSFQYSKIKQTVVLTFLNNVIQ